MQTYAISENEVPVNTTPRVVVDDSDAGSDARTPLVLKAIRAAFSVGGTIAPVATGRIAERMFFRPRRHQVPGRERAWMEGAKRDVVRLDNKPMAVWVWGDEPGVAQRTALLVHGWEGRASQMAVYAAPLVESGFRVVAFDAPAHGESFGKRTDGFQVSRAIAAMHRRFGDLDAVVAHSFGGICTMIAMDDGVRVGRIALIAPGVQGETFFRGFSDIVGLPRRATDVLRQRVISRFGADRWDRLDVAYCGQMLSRETRGAIVVHDEDDREVPYRQSVDLARHADAELITARGLGHRRIIRHDEVVDALSRFVAEQ